MEMTVTNILANILIFIFTVVAFYGIILVKIDQDKERRNKNE